MEIANENYCYKPKRMRKFIVGLTFISAGVLLLAFKLGYLPMEYKPIIFSWPMLFIALGFINLVSRDNWITGLIFIAGGAFFLLPKLMFLPIDSSELFWPIVLIGAGLISIFKRRRWHNRFHDRFQKHHGFKFENKETFSGNGMIDETNVFSGSKRKVTSQEFKGGRIINVFGGSELDLSQANLLEGEYILDVTCIFGGIKIILPSDWTVNLDIETSIMGGFADKRQIFKENINSKKVLNIKGTTVFGGGEIK